MAVSTERKSAVNVGKIAYAPLTLDSVATLTYGTVVDMSEVLVSVKYTPKMNQGKQFVSGREYDSYVAKAGGQLDVQVPALNAEDGNGLFGTTIDATSFVSKSTKDDVVPDVMVMYSTKTSGGKINLYKFPKCKFTDQGESATTSDENGITYTAQTISASYAALIHGGSEMYSIKGLDPTTDAATITAWFGTATGGTDLAS